MIGSSILISESEKNIISTVNVHFKNHLRKRLLTAMEEHTK